MTTRFMYLIRFLGDTPSEFIISTGWKYAHEGRVIKFSGLYPEDSNHKHYSWRQYMSCNILSVEALFKCDLEGNKIEEE